MLINISSKINHFKNHLEKRKILTKAQKKELCEKKRDNPNIKGIDLAQEYEISTQSVSDILKQSSQWLNYDASSSSASHHLYSNRTSDYPDIEEATRIWVDQEQVQTRMEDYYNVNVLNE